MTETCGILSDTHGYIDPYVFNQLRMCDCIIHAGDIGSYRIIEQLRTITNIVHAVTGNNDCTQKWPATEHSKLNKLPTTTQFTLGRYLISVIHGHQFNPVKQRHQKLRAAFPKADLIVYGHSHRFCIDQTSRPWIINPGAAGRSRTYGGARCIKLVASRQQLKIIECYANPL